MAYLHDNTDAAFGGLGWNCAYSIVGRGITPAGHEVITRDAIGPALTISFTVGGRPAARSLSTTDVNDIILGNRSVDLGVTDSDDSGAGLTMILVPAEQKRHALRSTYFQGSSAALSDIRAQFGRQHTAILREPDPRRRLRRIGVNLHLVQDSFSPAHTERNPSLRWCISRVRNYGAGFAPNEHGKPSDVRDTIAHGPSLAARAEATNASRRYLQIVFKALQGVLARDPVATVEASTELVTFMTDIFRSC